MNDKHVLHYNSNWIFSFTLVISTKRSVFAIILCLKHAHSKTMAERGWCERSPWALGPKYATGSSNNVDRSIYYIRGSYLTTDLKWHAGASLAMTLTTQDSSLHIRTSVLHVNRVSAGFSHSISNILGAVGLDVHVKRIGYPSQPKEGLLLHLHVDCAQNLPHIHL